MGALALPTPWIPEDDILLKNAIEAGASLESLAKGAVQFSRRFTIKELQDRWLALLYDPIISTKAADQMVELERSASTLASKSTKASDSSKGTKNDHGNGKRKVESVRRCYYAMRKRLCSEPHNQDDLTFLAGPGDNCFMNGVEAHVPEDMLGDPMAGHFALQHASFDGLGHAFSQVTGDGALIGEFPIEQHGSFGDHIGQSNMVANEMGIVEPSGYGMFTGSAIQANPDGKGIICSSFEENTIFNPSIPGCEAPFEHFHYTSPPPAMPDWKTMEGMSVPRLPDDISIRVKNIQSGEPFDIPDDEDGEGASEYEMQCDGDFKNPKGCNNGIFSALNDPLFSFTGEDELFIIDENFDGLKSLLLDSPNGAIDDRLPDVLDEGDPAASDVFIDIPSSSCPEGKNDAADPLMGVINLQNCSDAQMASTTARVDSEFPEFINGVICCTLNTEDPDIPCNNDIVFPNKPRPASANRRTQSEANNSSFLGKDNTATQSIGKAFGTTKRNQKRFGELHAASQMRGPDVVPNCAVDEPVVKFETPKAEAFNVPRISSNGYGVPCQSSLVVKKEPLELPLARQRACSFAEKPSQIADFIRLQPAVVGTSQGAHTSSAVRSQELPTPGSVVVMAAEPVGETLLSDPEEQFSESDTEIPYYSDVESMILDMDLGPEDQDFFCSREAAKYQHEDVKRAIIRLEQNAHSYMQRAISSHGAFAILYGRHSKHYIKKPEVLLGRATDDVMVDIDLGREGRANKISRRQAFIKMDKEGAFSLKNTGKCSIYVNSKEIFPGQSLGLHSNCLIEIRGMPFIFDTNQTRVKQYLDNAARKFEDSKLNIGRVG